ncbi:glutamine-hydrolyzing carbamoyl-phosphate synthase small subunit [Salisediminibacterium halotolerans]|uniref:glutamine-hydrolyzing carbamoyl-phosphate synthase small subunit n=1 Tax=Salisediminibacterium halotolerans TaxID=517425 RepID=UPI000EABC65F|nr:glutamine-hydrolyzing carbamoyl-phosphate synthase small subunit [Salisediminibacterium halotolerans]RLJ74288.1 carbamoyl-phosphate synthase small subunit [Actinophytocola xinjiangensis]RPE87619.1 carbamoyl-phosphate synthase small subunit [Salisediminibacterium halotolerans]TWG35125.1 carbamoyl-phosphate synthase small subunit [Salisediminibacterium halotolerans]GEL07316.1 carbamoyl-phosphate synthase pyrimidine-specific small chain [Salisediminibacterium halotolerans]
MKTRQLIMENGAVFTGEAFGSDRLTEGEVVFNTGMTGYQEILSDPSYAGQIVTLTYPSIGNCGINRDDFESMTPFLHGVIVRESAETPSHFRSERTLDEWLSENNIPGLKGIDTRRLTRMIRSSGAMKGRLCSVDDDREEVVKMLKSTDHAGQFIERTSTKKMYVSPGKNGRIVLIDYGAKKSLLKELSVFETEIVIVPHTMSARDILDLRPDGVALSNGPGDPKAASHAVKIIRELLGSVPIFGICLGHQLLAMAAGGDTEKMPFGHRGGNHPVKDLRTSQVTITAQNHGYTVRKDSLAGRNVEITHENVNDNTVEGISLTDAAAFSVQFHPESSAGPEDDKALFQAFYDEVCKHRNTKRGGAVYAETNGY